MNCTAHVRKDGCDIWVGTQVVTRARAAAAQPPVCRSDKVQVHNHLLGGGFGRRLDVDEHHPGRAIARQVDFPVKVIWSREEDIQHDVYRPYYYDRLAAGLDEKGLPIAWSHRVVGSSIEARWAPQEFANGLDSDAVEGAAGPYAFRIFSWTMFARSRPGLDDGLVARRRNDAQRLHGRRLHRRTGRGSEESIPSPTAALCSKQIRA